MAWISWRCHCYHPPPAAKWPAPQAWPVSLAPVPSFVSTRNSCSDTFTFCHGGQKLCPQKERWKYVDISQLCEILTRYLVIQGISGNAFQSLCQPHVFTNENLVLLMSRTTRQITNHARKRSQKLFSWIKQGKGSPNINSDISYYVVQLYMQIADKIPPY